MEMKFGVNTLVWVLSFTESDFNLLDKIRGMGFDVVEITPGAEFKKIDPEKLRNRLDETGLGVSLCGALDDAQDFSSTDEAVREKGIRFMNEFCDWAAEISARIIGGPLYSALGKSGTLSLTNAGRNGTVRRNR